MDRLQLQSALREIVDNVYFQPPDNLVMKYPCIRYERAPADTRFAANKPYKVTKRYTLTLITRDPVDDAWDKIAALEMCTHSSFFVAENLNHDVFDIFTS